MTHTHPFVHFNNYFACMEANLIVYFAQRGGTRRSHRSSPVFLPRSDPSKNIEKKDYKHIKYVLDRALLGFSMWGGYIQRKKKGRAVFRP
jgi:hypothetical protein